MSLYEEWKAICDIYDFPHSNYYNSDLRELLKMYVFLKGQYGNILKTLDDFAKRFDAIDEKIKTDIENALKPYTELIENTVKSVDNKIQALELKVESELNVLRTEVNEKIVKEEFARITGDSELKEYIKEVNETLQKEIEELTKKISESGIAIINPRRNKLQPVQEVIDDLYLAILQSGSYNSSELSEYPTCDTIATSNMSYDVFTVASKELGQRLINNVVTGQKGDINYALSSLKGYNQTFGLNNAEISADTNITVDSISNLLVNYTQFIMRSKLLIDNTDISLGIWQDGKELKLHTYVFNYSSNSTFYQHTFAYDRVIELSATGIRNDGNVIDVSPYIYLGTSVIQVINAPNQLVTDTEITLKVLYV